VLPIKFTDLAVIDVTNCTCTSKHKPISWLDEYIPILTWGFVRSKAVAYVRAAFKTIAPFFRRRACCKGLTELPCCRADRAVRRKGVTVRANAGMINELMQIKKRGEKKNMLSILSTRHSRLDNFLDS
jgi:hypothetical protein